VNLTLAWTEPNRVHVNSIFDQLIKLDPLRTNYYKDLKIYELKSLTNLSPSKHLEKLLITENPISDALKDVPNSQLLLADNLQIISCTTGSDTCPSVNHMIGVDVVFGEIRLRDQFVEVVLQVVDPVAHLVDAAQDLVRHLLKLVLN
ncbi:unnamed protein product, partial [Oppiella nova]